MNTVEEIIEDLRQGKMVVITDDEDRENEGDLVMAAAHVRAEDINFMARYGRGLICLTLTRDRCQQLFHRQAGGSGPAGARVSAHGPAWRRVEPGRAYRGGLRSGSPGRGGARRGDRRDPE
ncbi:MAG: ribBA [Proteobacteria bacterium]|nr:ribBA [Pseudomonadota bacterium]